MATIYPTRATDADGVEHILWMAEAYGQVIGTGDTPEEASQAAYEALEKCAEVARRRKLPNRYINTLSAEAKHFQLRLLRDNESPESS